MYYLQNVLQFFIQIKQTYQTGYHENTPALRYIASGIIKSYFYKSILDQVLRFSQAFHLNIFIKIVLSIFPLKVQDDRATQLCFTSTIYHLTHLSEIIRCFSAITLALKLNSKKHMRCDLHLFFNLHQYLLSIKLSPKKKPVTIQIHRKKNTHSNAQYPHLDPPQSEYSSGVCDVSVSISDRCGYRLVGCCRTAPFVCASFLLLFTFILLTSSNTDRTTGESWEPGNKDEYWMNYG